MNPPTFPIFVLMLSLQPLYVSVTFHVRCSGTCNLKFD